jgi:hypothetical protein
MELNNDEEILKEPDENICTTLNQNFQPESESKDQNTDKKPIKFDINSITEIPIKTSCNLRYGDNGYNDLDPQTKKIINDPKYADEKRSKSAFSKKSYREKYEGLKIKIPTNREWNRDPTAEVIIHNLEQKIDILTYENFLLSKKLREIENANKELKLNISHNLMVMKAEQEMNNEENIKHNLKNEFNIKNQDKKNKKNKKEKNEKDVDLFEEINKLKDENNRLRLSNQNLAENNAELNQTIELLKNQNNLNKENKENKDEDNHKENNIENNIQDRQNQNNIINLNNNNLDINNNEDAKIPDEQNNSVFDINKYLLSEEKYHELIEENELLHKKLRSLLLIDGDSKLDFKNTNLIFKKYNNNIENKETNNNKNEELAKENNSLKQKIKSLNSELNKMAVEYNRKILLIQERLDEYELKQKQNLINEKNKININEREKKEREEELDEILNETLLIMGRNQDDSESKKMIDTIKNIKNEQKKRISQCLIINNKLKSLLQENSQLQNQLLLSKKENEMINNTNSNYNNMNNINNNATNPHICFCGSGNFSVNALKIRDEMIIKYKDKIDENNEIMKLTQSSYNSNTSNIKRKNESNYTEKDNSSSNKMKKERNDGFEDYLLGKIVNNQKEVLGERAPRFYENNNINNNKYAPKSMQYEDNKNNRYNNNYHYRKKIMEDDE